MTEPTPPEGQPPATGYVVPPGYGQPYQLPYAPAPKTNGLAIASLVTSIVALSFCTPLAFIGAIMGHAARRQIRERGEDGDGLALAGIVVGWIGVGLVIVLIAFIALIAAMGAFNESTYDY
jgi:Domain of unknown function (DUF4190)